MQGILSFAVLPPHLPRGDHRGDEDLTPRLVGLELVRPALDAVTILLIDGADNNGTVVPCSNRWGEASADSPLEHSLEHCPTDAAKRGQRNLSAMF